ncbi:MAG TPA: hypothetical protein VFL71_06180 [Actinomycetes bacterium]|jgi:signal transduction histidine kinase|nr:hypothetical protein [Actinomycetes bacterium]
MAANTVGTDDARAPADDPYRAVTDAHGFGLSCMRERLQAIGGQLTLRTAPGAGTCIEARAASHAPP